MARTMRKIDAFQRSRRSSAFAFGVVKKYGDDNGGSLAALLTYYGFLSMVPLMLVLFTVLGLIARPGSSVEHSIVDSALSQFPVIGDQIAKNIRTLHNDSPVGLTIGLIGLLWGSTGVCQSAQYAMAQVWNIPKLDRPGFLPRLGRSGMLFALGGVFLVVSSFFAGVATFSGKQAVVIRIAGALLSLAADVGLFMAAFRILTPKAVYWRQLLPGAIAGGVIWAVLQSLGVFLMDHEIRNMGDVSGFFATVLGLLWWIYLGAQVLVYSAEINVVRYKKLWPRSLAPPPLTEADRCALSDYALAERRRPEIVVSTHESDASDQTTHSGSSAP